MVSWYWYLVALAVVGIIMYVVSSRSESFVPNWCRSPKKAKVTECSLDKGKCCTTGDECNDIN